MYTILWYNSKEYKGNERTRGDVLSILAVWTIFSFWIFHCKLAKNRLFFWIEKDSLPWKDSYSWIVSSDVMAVISSVSFSEWIEIASSDFWCSRLTGLLLPPLLSESPFSVLFCRKLSKRLKFGTKIEILPGAIARGCPGALVSTSTLGVASISTVTSIVAHHVFARIPTHSVAAIWACVGVGFALTTLKIYLWRHQFYWILTNISAKGFFCSGVAIFTSMFPWPLKSVSWNISIAFWALSADWKVIVASPVGSFVFRSRNRKTRWVPEKWRYFA